ncbi:MAG: DNA replication/repair protein RecF [Streptosporangiaceae bacterium]
MHLTRLALTDFRSYVSADLTLEAGVTTLIGPNGEGKTNLAEAIGYVATLGSHRVATDAPLVRQGAERAIVRAAIASGRGNALIEIEVNPGRANRVRLNRTPLPRAREILGVLRTVLFAPEDLALVKGDPGERRRFLDDLLVARAPRYAAVRSDYERIVRQRTALLKSAGARLSRGGRVAGPAESAASADARSGAAPSTRSGTGPAASAMAATLDAWDDQLARVGAELLAGRLSLVRVLRPHVEAAYAAVSGDRGPAGIAYRPSFALPVPGGPPPGGPPPGDTAHGDGVPGGSAAPGGPGTAGMDSMGGKGADLEAAMREALQQARPGELERGVCLVGPHRDELELRVGELPARGYASHGESWSLALALRLAAYELLRTDGEDPVLILDDVFAELDAGRRDRLAVLVAGAEQVIVTAAVPADVPAALKGISYDVGGGTITRGG